MWTSAEMVIKNTAAVTAIVSHFPEPGGGGVEISRLGELVAIYM